MAKRFVDTELFKDPFVRDLTGEMKLLWVYLFTHCDNAGIWPVELDVAELRLGFRYNHDDVVEVLGDRIVQLDGESTWFIPAFIKFQYTLPLCDDNRALRSVISKLNDKNLLVEDENAKGVYILSNPPSREIKKSAKGDHEFSEPPSQKKEKSLKGLRTKTKNKDKDKDKEEEKEKEEEKGKNVVGVTIEVWPTFTDFWNEYDKKVGDKQKIKRKWDRLIMHEKELIMSHLPRYKLSVSDKQYRKNPETYLNNRSWNDEIIENTKSKAHRLTSEQRMALASDTSF